MSSPATTAPEADLVATKAADVIVLQYRASDVTVCSM